MKHEKAIVAILFLALAALTVAAVFASRVPPKLLPQQTAPTSRVDMPSKPAPAPSL